MPHRCSVYGCRSNYDSETMRITVFSLPTNPNRRKVWLDQIPTDFSKLKAPGVCIKHFDESHIIRIDRVMDKGELKEYPRIRPKLTANAVPTIFPSTPPASKKGSRKRKKLRQGDDDGGDNVDAIVHEMLEKGDSKRKKLPQSEDDGGDNVESILHQMLAKPQEVMINEEIIVKQEVEPDIDDLVDAGRQQDLEYVPVKEEPTEDPDESTCSATEETREQMGRDQELPLIIKEEIDCDNYVDPFHIPQEAYLQ